MLLSRKWLDEFVHVDANDKDFAEAMTLSGSKVETTEAYDNLDPKAFYDFMINMVLEWQEEQQAEAASQTPAPETESPAAEPSASPAA